MSEEQKKLKDVYDKVLAIYARGFERIEQLLKTYKK